MTSASPDPRSDDGHQSLADHIANIVQEDDLDAFRKEVQARTFPGITALLANRPDRKTLLHLACESTGLRILHELLLRHRQDIRDSTQNQDSEGYYPLHRLVASLASGAIQHVLEYQRTCLSRLVELGGTRLFWYRMPDGRTLLHVAAASYPENMGTAVTDMLERLLELMPREEHHGYQRVIGIDDMDSSGNTALHLSVTEPEGQPAQSQWAKRFTLLREAGADLSIPNSDGQNTVLHLLVMKQDEAGKDSGRRFLIQQNLQGSGGTPKANVWAENEANQNAMRLALSLGDLDTVELIVEHIQQETGPRDEALQKVWLRDGCDAFRAAVTAGHYGLLRRLIKDGNLDLAFDESDEPGQTMLHKALRVAVDHEDMETAEQIVQHLGPEAETEDRAFLLERDRGNFSRDSHTATPEFYRKLLLHRSADMSLSTDQRYGARRSILHKACNSQKEPSAIVKILLHADDPIDLFAVDYSGRTALDYAAERGHWATVSLLIDHGAMDHMSPEQRLELLHVAGKENNFDVVDRVRRFKPRTINLGPSKYTSDQQRLNMELFARTWPGKISSPDGPKLSKQVTSRFVYDPRMETWEVAPIDSFKSIEDSGKTEHPGIRKEPERESVHDVINDHDWITQGRGWVHLPANNVSTSTATSAEFTADTNRSWKWSWIKVGVASGFSSPGLYLCHISQQIRRRTLSELVSER